MKKTKYFAWMVAAGLALTGCSDELEGGGTPVINEGATGYAKVSINLPTTVGTRAENDKFDDGLDSEYAVKEGIILYFSPSTTEDTEANATFVGAYSLPLGNWNMVHTEDTENPDVEGDYTSFGPITTETTVVAQAPLVDNVSQLYALVILNPNNVFELNNNNHSLTINASTATTLTTSSNSTFASVQALVAGARNEDFNIIDDYISDGFMMLNAPLASKAVTSSDRSATVSIMPKLSIYENESSAASSTATDIYMERAMAKVTISGFDEADDGTLSMAVTKSNTSSADESDASFTLDGWTLDVTNKWTYLVHNVKDYSTWFNYTEPNSATQSRFVSAATPFRLYWANDNNYNGSSYGTPETLENKTSVQYTDQFNYIQGMTDTDIKWKKVQGEGNPIYCLENTFDTNNQDEDQTTRIVFKGTYHINNAEEAESFFVVGDQEKTTTLSVEQFREYINGKVTSFLTDTWEPTETLKGGKYSTIADFASLLGKSETTDATDLATIQAAVGYVKYYKDGQTFYHLQRIKHFGDELTPWTSGTDYTDANHLGRYGVVRNNWYEIVVTAITGPGEPEIPDTPPTPDDEETGFVKATIKILSWARRPQSVVLE